MLARTRDEAEDLLTSQRRQNRIPSAESRLAPATIQDDLSVLRAHAPPVLRTVAGAGHLPCGGWGRLEPALKHQISLVASCEDPLV